jgi:transcriptional regulator of aroF, aroG, tyrA and aromatic amino acid transport
MTLDVLQVFARYNVDIQAMEVEPGSIYLRFPQALYIPAIEEELKSLPGVHGQELIAALPQERRRQEMGAIVEAVSEGLIAIDGEGRITLLNAAAEAILRVKAQTVLGQKIAEVLDPNVPMLKTLSTGKGYDNQQMQVKSSSVNARYLTSGRPLLDSAGGVYGAVASIKDIGQVRALVHSLTRSSEITFAEILGDSPVFRNVVELARKICDSDATVLIYGESGTGKELFARSIHSGSPRRDMPFVPINCGALPDTLLESELFGYEDGAFTGARRGGRMGLFEFAHGGTIFLDEVAEIPSHLQAKLLRALHSGCIRRVGSTEEIRVNVRIVAATNKDLRTLVQEQKFREDLYYRLNVIPLQLPPLRQRREDIPILARHILARSGAKLSKDALAILMNNPWRGNVRELENVLERAVAIAGGGGTIGKGHLLLEPGNDSEVILRGTLKERVGQIEKSLVETALARFGSSRRAGQALGLSHTSILNKVKKYGLERLVSDWQE